MPTTTIHLAGQVVGCTELSAAAAHCKFWVVADQRLWRRIEGADEGTSHSDEPGDGGMIVFQHPVDVAYEALEDRSLPEPSQREWPRVEVEVRFRDAAGRSDLAGYGVVRVPPRPGVHELSCRIWRPKGTIGDRIAAFFIGGNPHLKSDALRYGLTDENDHGAQRLMRAVGRQRITSVPSGVVHMSIGVIMRTQIDPDE